MFQYVHVFCTEKLRPGQTTPDILSACFQYRSITSLSLPEMIFLKQHSTAAGHLCSKGVLLAHVPLYIHQELHVLLCKAVSCMDPSCICVWSSISPVAFPYAEVQQISVIPFLQPVSLPLNNNMTIWYISAFLLFCIICIYLLRVHSLALSRSSVKM